MNASFLSLILCESEPNAQFILFLIEELIKITGDCSEEHTSSSFLADTFLYNFKFQLPKLQLVKKMKPNKIMLKSFKSFINIWEVA